MKKKENFLQSSEKYLWKIIGRSRSALPYLIIVLILSAIVTSLITKNISLAGSESLREAVERALRVGDYEKARELWSRQNANESMSRVLGATSELEQKIYPEKMVGEKIEALKEVLNKYEGHRDIMLEIARLYGELGMTELKSEYFEQARILDPNNEIFKK